MFALAFPISGTSQDLVTVVHAFGSYEDSNTPTGGVIQGADGDFYGVSAATSSHGGTIFRMTPAGGVTTLHTFDRSFGTNVGGASPIGELVSDGQGTFYGVTYEGGQYGQGTVFKITAAGTFTTLVNFTGSNTGAGRGTNPSAALLLGEDGNLYGTTAYGGANNRGTVFGVTPSGTHTVLVDFDNVTRKGQTPLARLEQGGDASLYGTTYQGGANFQGTVFKVTLTGNFTTLAEFPASTSSSKGARPRGGLVKGPGGFLYGSTRDGGSGGTGTLFKITPSGILTTLYSFAPINSAANSNPDGANPTVTLTLSSSGALYGTTVSGGTVNYGTVFRVTSDGTLTSLYSFTFDGPTGVYPGYRLVQAASGDFYGVAESGPGGGGVIYRVALTEEPGRHPLVFIPGIAGSMLTGNGQTGANGNHEYLWPTLGAQDIRALNLYSSVSDIQAVGIVLEYDPIFAGIEKLIVYGPLMNYLVNDLRFREFNFAEHPERMTNNYLLQQSWPEKPTLFTFPYDWRQTNNSHVDRLHDYISQIRQLHGGAKVDVIAHSMGGILLRQYMLTADYASDINKVITIGTPCWGSPKALYRMLTGEFYPFKIVDLLNSIEMKAALRSMPSTAELLPPFQDGHISGRTALLSEDRWDLNGEGGVGEVYSPAAFWKYVNSIAPGFQTINTTLHSAAQDDWHGDSSSIPYLQVSGLVAKTNGQPTTASDVVAFEKNWSVLGIRIRQVRGFRENERTIGPGDNVVPAQSADRPSQYRAPNTQVLSIPGDSDDPETSPAEHLELTKHREVHANIAAFLGLTPTSGAAPAAPVSPQLSSGTRRSVTIFGIGYVPITDSAGNRNTQLTDMAIQKIPGLNIQYHADEGWIEIEGDSSKEFTITSPAVTAELEAQIVSYNSAGTADSLIRYRFAPSAEGWRLSAASGTSQLAVDTNKNGVFEAGETVPPSHQVTGPVDNIAPTLDASYSEAAGSVVVQLTAHDDVTADPAIRYTVNDGTVQNYQTPLSFPLSGSAVLKAFAEDGMGNTSALLTTTVPPITTGTLGNISTRLRVQGGDNVLIGGMIATGTSSKKVIIRAIGPTLGDFGVPGALADPTLQLYQGDTLFFSNDDWRSSSQQAEIAASGFAPNKDAESAIIWTLTPGQNYTAIVRGKNDQSGVAVVEAFDLDVGAASKLGNISTRGFVDLNDNVMIAGLIVSSNNGSGLKVLVRALGPTLGDFGVPGVLANPTLDLVNSSGAVIRSNDNWKDSQRNEIEAAQLTPSHDQESALVETLVPGAYTAIVRGSGQTTGAGLVEVYNIP